MEYNPLTPKVRARREDLQKLRNAVSERKQQLAWYNAFDPTAAANLAAVEESTITELTFQRAELQAALVDTKRRVGSIRPATRRGLNPQYWFSETRATAKSELGRCVDQIKKIESDMRRQTGELANSMTSLTDARESLEWYSKFDSDEVEVTHDWLESEIGRKGAELEKWEAREKALDTQLEVPRSEVLNLRSRLGGLERDLQKAKRVDRQLGEANNGYEKSQIHRKCEVEFGHGSPRRVIDNIQNEITGTKRNIEKLERRLQQIGRRGALDVQKLIIDGSNLCYEADMLIGLAALRSLCDRLSNDFEFVVVFDASIKEKLGLPRDDLLRSQLPGVTVYVAASRTGADETILDAAQEHTTYVISNDRFVDFLDKPAVRDGRLLTHAIINGRVLVHDLSINVEFSNRR